VLKAILWLVAEILNMGGLILGFYLVALGIFQESKPSVAGGIVILIITMSGYASFRHLWRKQNNG
jgi:hypothetical protein